MRRIKFAGVDLTDEYGLYVSAVDAYRSPSYEYEKISIPGRSGDVLVKDNRFSNRNIKYRFGIKDGFKDKYPELMRFLLLNGNYAGYQKLEDSERPDGYYMAVVSGEVSPDLGWLGKEGQFEITFNCKPQFYLNSGDEEYYLVQNTSEYRGEIFRNLITGFDSKPIIKIETPTIAAGSEFIISFYYSSGTKNVHFKTLSTYSLNYPLYVDCEEGWIYYYTPSRAASGYLTVFVDDHGFFPDFVRGQLGGIAMSAATSHPSSIVNHWYPTKVSVIPKWFTM